METSPPTCIIEDGVVSMRDLLIPRSGSGLASKSDIHVRDLLSLAIQSRRQISIDDENHSLALGTQFTDNNSSSLILPRGDAILVKMGHVKAVAWKDEALLFDSGRPDVQLFARELNRIILSRPLKDLEPKTSASSSMSIRSELAEDRPNSVFGASDSFDNAENDIAELDRSQHFELLFLESVLRETCNTWHRRITLYRPVVSGLLSSITGEIQTESGMHRLVPLKDSLQGFEMEVTSAIKCIVDLLSNDEDMLAILLSEKHLAKSVNNGKDEQIVLDPRLHDEVELLLEDYNRQ